VGTAPVPLDVRSETLLGSPRPKAVCAAPRVALCFVEDWMEARGRRELLVSKAWLQAVALVFL
jgi:hypothetical protein